MFAATLPHAGNESGTVSGRGRFGGREDRHRAGVFLSFAIDDAARAPIIIFAAGGGSGIEERAASTKRIDPAKHGYDEPPPRAISDGNPKSQDPNPREKGDQR